MIYLDNSATSSVDEEVYNEMKPYFKKYFGNPSSLHSYGVDALNAIDNSRERIAKTLNAENNEIIFTSGGTESDNLALKGISYLNKDKRKKNANNIITSSIEHPAVLETCKFLEKEGFDVKYLPVNKYGLIDINDLEKAITKKTFLISIMYANNEIGTIEPIREISKLSNTYDILFHTDAVQAIYKTNIDLKKIKIDLMSISSHKIYGPKGVGALYVRKGVNINPIIHGGGQEKNIRSGTLNTPGIVGLGKACEIGYKRMNNDNNHLKNLRDMLIKKVLKIDNSFLNGHPTKRLVNNTNFCFNNIEGESLVMMLDENGIASSTGSACSSKKSYSSYVLREIGLKENQAQSSLRLTIGRKNTSEEIKYVSNIVSDVVKNLRRISPI